MVVVVLLGWNRTTPLRPINWLLPTPPTRRVWPNQPCSRVGPPPPLTTLLPPCPPSSVVGTVTFGSTWILSLALVPKTTMWSRELEAGWRRSATPLISTTIFWPPVTDGSATWV